MARSKLTLFLLQLSWTFHLIAAIQRTDLFPYGESSRDLILHEGDDETSKRLALERPLCFYETSFNELYVATNGIVSAQDLPMEKQYVDDGFPTDFPVIAPFLADIDTSNGRGSIYYRVTEAPSILNRVAQEVHRGFPDGGFTPTHVVIATWENVAAYEEGARGSGPSNKVNTFQAVVAYNEMKTYALFLYPEDGLQFFGTRPKESYNVEIELPARVGFSRGEVPYFIFSRIEGPYYSVTSNEQSIKNLYQVGNTGVPGVWLFHIGNCGASFQNVVPASVSGVLATPLSRHHASPTPDYAEEEYPEEDDHDYLTEETDFQTSTHPEFLEPGPPLELPVQTRLQPYGGDLPLTSDPQHSDTHPASGRGEYPPPKARIQTPEDASQAQAPPQPQAPQPQAPQRQAPQPGHTAMAVFPNREKSRGLDILPPLSPDAHVVNIEDEDVDFETGVIQYSTENKETCARFQQQCSQNAYCTDYSSGFCCHCRFGFYGNGRHCLPDGAPHRVNGKVTGKVTVGSTQIDLGSIDMHAYIVVGDGRAYTAISEVPEPIGWALMPVAPIGELFGWLFALELPNSRSGFKITGAEFTRYAEVTFYPGNQRLSIVQTARGLDEQNYLKVDTHLHGSVPFTPPGATIQMEPFKETFQYYPSVVTSTSTREYTVVSAERGSESLSFHLRQNITYRDCRHGPPSGPETQQLTMERIFVMYVKEERILRYAITDKIGPVGVDLAEPGQVNPCYSGTHDCDTTAQCLPGDGLQYQCQCATGYTGDGRNCYDVDECVEGLSSCGAHGQCVNLPGSHRCQCQTGYEFGFDGRTCLDVDECASQPCDPNASCSNTLGSYQCRCKQGYQGNGVQCVPEDGQLEHPKTQCESHRDSLQAGVDPRGSRPGPRPPLGAFVPQCDEQGQYRPLQCHGSTGHCWCVDNRGQERAGTRTPPGTPPTNCDEQERPATHCEQHRASLQHSPEGYPIVGAFVPDCDEQGQYRPLQCHGSTGHCWCVDNRGQERAGTKTPPGSPQPNCNEPERPKTHCEQHRARLQHNPEGYPIVGAFVPDCDEQGQYRPLQCHGSTGHCWCVDNRGQERAGTKTPPGNPQPNCNEEERPKTHCEQHRARLQHSPEGYPIVGAFVPDCDEQGQYRPLQCHGSTGHCWCVDNRGQERAGTKTPPGSPQPNCNEPGRPKTHCEQHRASLQHSPEGYPIVGAFVPDCDEQGQYRPLQCHGSTGHCWCVDDRGQERAGTRTPPGNPQPNCNEEERPKTHCEQHRARLQHSPEGYPIVGAFVPQCDEQGQYRPLQCHGSTGHCWCVDNRGQERAGTKTPPGNPQPNCNEEGRPKTHCEQHRASLQHSSEGYPIVGAFVPDCDEQGQYRPLQCHGSTGHCWCVDNRGQERAGTKTPPGSPQPNCNEPGRPKTHCEQHRASLQHSPEGYPIVGAFVPDCDEQGQYRPLQCHGSTGHCWCVDDRGQERAGTRTPPGNPQPNCNEEERPKTHCEQHRARLQHSPEGYPIVGAFVPQCDEQGQYRPLQCHGSTGHCWCVDNRGQERAGTKTPPGNPQPNCNEEGRPKTHCEQHRASLQHSPEGYPIVGAFVPDCDEQGQYRPLQCHGSTGHCWCVDDRGQERAGTKTPPGSPQPNCNEPGRPKTHCEQHRASLQHSPEGYPIVGAFVPDCDEQGQYRPLQCHGSTGHCWCVDNRGQERAGTRTPPGTPQPNCNEPERPKTHCEQHRARLQHSPEGYPIVGAFVPDCDEQGQYRPLQCHGSTGHCWCVDNRGQERAGTRTPPGNPQPNCNEEVAPTRRPETVCERWRASLLDHYGGKPEPQHYLPQCDSDGQFNPVQCYGDSSYCWCVDRDGREVTGTRSHDAVKPACIPTVAPPTMHPLPRPDVTTPHSSSGTSLLYAQGQQIGALPLNGTIMDQEHSSTLLALHGSIVVGLDYDCKERKVYWTDLAGRTISRASLERGAEPEILINTGLTSPEGLAVDVERRAMFWVDSTPDKIEQANLDGSGRRVLFDTDLVNPRAIIVDSSTGTLYWTDWNRESPKIERASVDGHSRKVLVNDGIGLPNALTLDTTSRQVCWADAGTKRLECISPDGTGRRVIHSNLNYPFSMVFYNNHFYYTDWRRDGVMAVRRDGSQYSEEYLPDQRSHLYGIAVATSHCISGRH